MSEHTPGPWFVAGARHRMDGSEWHSVNRYDEAKKQDLNIACVGYDPRTGEGFADARLIAAAPEMYEALLQAQGVLAMFIDPHAIGNTTTINAYAQAVEAETRARTALALVLNNEKSVRERT